MAELRKNEFLSILEKNFSNISNSRQIIEWFQESFLVEVMDIYHYFHLLFLLRDWVRSQPNHVLSQRSKGWKCIRDFICTSSRFGHYAGFSLSAKDTLRTVAYEEVFDGDDSSSGEESSCGMEIGSHLEPLVQSVYLEVVLSQHEDLESPCFASNLSSKLELVLHEHGLQWAEPFFLGFSPDGVLEKKWVDTGLSEYSLLEIKIPFFKMYLDIGIIHYCQIQGIMALSGLPYCDYVCYHPQKGTNNTLQEVKIMRIDYNPEFWFRDLLPKLKEYFFFWFLPLKLHCINGWEIPPALQLSDREKITLSKKKTMYSSGNFQPPHIDRYMELAQSFKDLTEDLSLDPLSLQT